MTSAKFLVLSQFTLKLDSERFLRTTFAAIRTLEAIRRSKLAEFRTGISVRAITLSILTILISTPAFWNPTTVMLLLIVVGILIVVLLIVGVFFFYCGLRGMERLIKSETN